MPAQHGYLLLSDISGYVSYLAGVELEHAQEILSELLELLVGRLRPVLAVASLERDAVLAYAPSARVPRGETLMELIEAAYAAFRDRQANISRRLTCTCRACREVSSLDLKFLLHHGEYLARPAGDRMKLTGLDVELVRRREIKHPVQAATGWRGFLLVTEPGRRSLGLWPEALPAEAETFPWAGGVTLHALPLQPRYQEVLDARRFRLPAGEAHLNLSHELAAPPAVVWEWLNDPARRSRWQAGRQWTAGARRAGRTAAGASNHCLHSGGSLTETILDWRPFEYFTARLQQAHWPGVVVMTAELEPAGQGTRLHTHLKLERPGLPPPIGRALTRGLARLLGLSSAYAALQRQIAAPPSSGEFPELGARR